MCLFWRFLKTFVLTEKLHLVTAELWFRLLVTPGSIFRSMEASDLRIKRLITLMQAVRLSTRVIFTILAEKDLGAAESMAEIICLDVFIKKIS